MHKQLLPKNELEILQQVFRNDIDLFLFYITWLKNGLVAKFAYKELHPNVTDGSAEVLGSRMLSRVKPELIFQAYGLDIPTYLSQLKAGLGAMKRDKVTGEMYEDHTARKSYHDKLGKLLGIEPENHRYTIRNSVQDEFMPLNEFISLMEQRSEKRNSLNSPSTQ